MDRKSDLCANLGTEVLSGSPAPISSRLRRLRCQVLASRAVRCFPWRLRPRLETESGEQEAGVQAGLAYEAGTAHNQTIER